MISIVITLVSGLLLTLSAAAQCHQPLELLTTLSCEHGHLVYIEQQEGNYMNLSMSLLYISSGIPDPIADSSTRSNEKYLLAARLSPYGCVIPMKLVGPRDWDSCCGQVDTTFRGQLHLQPEFYSLRDSTIREKRMIECISGDIKYHVAIWHAAPALCECSISYTQRRGMTAQVAPGFPICLLRTLGNPIQLDEEERTQWKRFLQTVVETNR